MTILDIAQMPGWNPVTGKRGTTSVSDGKVYWDENQRGMCVRHGAINCVSPDRRLWRCVHAYTCGEGFYITGELTWN